VLLHKDLKDLKELHLKELKVTLETHHRVLREDKVLKV